MIREYALDPQVVADCWQDFRFFIGEFGCEKGRMISRFPSKWKKNVYDLCKENIEFSELQISRVEVILFNPEYKFDRKFVRNSREYDKTFTWVQNAVKSNNDRPFFAIITKEFHQGTILSSKIDGESEIWKTVTSVPTLRTAVEMGKCFKPFFDLANEIIFVEPHFDPGTYGYNKAFKHYFRELFSSNKKYKKIEIHTLANIELNHFIEEFKNKFANVIVKDSEIVVFRWKRLSENENFHPRYLLTEIGGIRIDYGFDESSENETTDIQTIGDAIYETRIQNLNKDSGVYELEKKIQFEKTVTELKYKIIN